MRRSCGQTVSGEMVSGEMVSLATSLVARSGIWLQLQSRMLRSHAMMIKHIELHTHDPESHHLTTRYLNPEA